MAVERDQVVVHLDAEELAPRCPVGTLSRERSRGRSVISFAYDRSWLAAPDAFPIDPALPLYEGDQHVPALPGVFADAAPDRWGRDLLERREARAARRGERQPRRLDEWDFLVAVDDRTRMGALRLSRAGETEGSFVGDDPLPVPPLARLRELEHFAREAEAAAGGESSEEERWLAMLVAPGSSLGGARPKANYLDGESLWIAKFPSREDRHDVGAWEHVVARLASSAGIEAPETRLLSLGSSYRTFCARRFDRVGGRRRLYASAMTLTGRRDNEDASYLDIAQAIENLGDPAAIEADLHQLFKRVAFNVLVGNRDDHLRNHGFLRVAGGWRLAPAFDVNPSPEKIEHSLALDEALHVPDLDAVRATAPLYRLSAEDAERTISEIDRVVAGWRAAARGSGLGADELELIGRSFALA